MWEMEDIKGLATMSQIEGNQVARMSYRSSDIV
jgi:hypothetical protein